MSPGDPAHILHGASPAASQKESGKGSEDGDSIFSVKGISSRLSFHCSSLLIGLQLPFRLPFQCPFRCASTASAGPSTQAPGSPLTMND